MKRLKCDRLWLTVPGRLRQVVKRGIQSTLLRRSWAKKKVFIAGFQRSGTKMLLQMFDFSMLTRVFDEDDDNEAFLNYRLRSSDELQHLMSQINAPVVVFKPLCESHYVDRFLDYDGASRAIWIYRHYADVADSAVRKWGGHLKETVDKICAGRADELGWRGEGIRDDTLAKVKSVYRSDLSDREGACLFWYVRNRIVADLGLQKDSRVRIVRYSALVSQPRERFRQLYEFIGIPFSTIWADWIYSSSMSEDVRPDIDVNIIHLCEDLLAGLDNSAAVQ